MIYALGAAGVMLILGIGMMILHAGYLEATKKTEEETEGSIESRYRGLHSNRRTPR